MAKQTHKRSKHFQIPYSHFGRNGLAFPLTEAMTCAITLFKRTRSTVRNESYKRRWQSQVLAPFSHPNEVQKPQTVKISTGNNECPNVQTSHPLFIRVVTWVLQITPLTKEREPSVMSAIIRQFFWRFVMSILPLMGFIDAFLRFVGNIFDFFR